MTEEKVLESSLLKVSVYLPPLGRAVDALAQVLRARKAKKGFFYYVAIQFLDLNHEDRQAIDEFANNLSQDEGASFLIDHADVVVRKR